MYGPRRKNGQGGVCTSFPGFVFQHLFSRASVGWTQAMSSRGRANVDPHGGQSYSVASMSLVFHTASPLVPTFRADVRYMEVRHR